MHMVCSMNYGGLFCLCIAIGLFQRRCTAIEDKHWTTRPGTKFEYNYDSTQKHCDDAQNECQRYDANLASILSKEENEFLTKDFLNISTMPNFDHYPWFGLIRQANQTDWKWIDNSNLTYKAWKDGQPDEVSTFTVCSKLGSVNGTGKWYDSSTDTESGFICKRENLCLTKPCQNNGKCFRSVDGNYSCSCLPNHGGIHCDLENFCYYVECEHNSTCENTINDFRCHCTDNYRGRLCEQEIPISFIAMAGPYIIFSGVVIVAILVLVAVIVVIICCCKKNRNKRKARDPLNMEYTSFKRTSAPTRCSDASLEIAYDEIEIKKMNSATSKEEQKPQKRHNYVNTTIDRNANSDNQYEMYSFPNKDGKELISNNSGLNKKNYDDKNADYAFETLPMKTDKEKPNDNVEYSLETLPSNASRKGQNDNNQPQESAPLMKAITQEKGNTGGYDNVRISSSDTGKYDNVEIKKASDDVANSGTLNTKLLEQETEFVTNEIYGKT